MQLIYDFLLPSFKWKKIRMKCSTKARIASIIFVYKLILIYALSFLFWKFNLTATKNSPIYRNVFEFFIFVCVFLEGRLCVWSLQKVLSRILLWCKFRILNSIFLLWFAFKLSCYQTQTEINRYKPDFLIRETSKYAVNNCKNLTLKIWALNNTFFYHWFIGQRK